MNKIFLMGRMTADPELKTTPNGISVTRFTLAVDRDYVKSGAERQTDFIDVVAWRHTAEFVCKYFCKGQLTLVCGALETRSYTDKNGVNRKAFEVIADSVHFTGDRRGDNRGSSQYDNTYGGNQYGENSYNNQYSQIPTPSAAPTYSSGSTGDFTDIPSDDDLPF